MIHETWRTFLHPNVRPCNAFETHVVNEKAPHIQSFLHRRVLGISTVRTLATVGEEVYVFLRRIAAVDPCPQAMSIFAARTLRTKIYIIHMRFANRTAHHRYSPE